MPINDGVQQIKRQKKRPSSSNCPLICSLHFLMETKTVDYPHFPKLGTSNLLELFCLFYLF